MRADSSALFSLQVCSSQGQLRNWHTKGRKWGAVLEKLRLMLSKCNPPNIQGGPAGHSEDSRQFSRAAAGHPIWKLHRKSSWSEADIRDKPSCATRVEKGYPCQSSHWNTQAHWRAYSPPWQNPRRATDRKAVTLDSHLLSKLWFCFME